MDDADSTWLFRRLVAPLETPGFVAGVWERESRALPGHAGRFDDLDVDLDRFWPAIERLPARSVRANHIDEDGAGHYPWIDARDAPACFAQGKTICVTHLHHAMPRLADLARATRQALALAGAVGVNAYLSPAGCGFGLHLDMQSVFILQIEGEKHWLYGAHPAAPFPPEGMDAYPDAGRAAFRTRYPGIPLVEPNATDWRQCVLRPGDALYLPPGTWHQGTAGGHSLALTLTCCTVNVASLLLPLLRTTLSTDEAWRRNLPSGVTADGATREAFIAARLADLDRCVGAMSAAALVRLWDGELAGEPAPRL